MGVGHRPALHQGRVITPGQLSPAAGPTTPDSELAARVEATVADSVYVTERSWHIELEYLLRFDQVRITDSAATWCPITPDLRRPGMRG